MATTLREMPPALAEDDHSDQASAYTSFPGNLCVTDPTCRVLTPDLGDGLIGQFRGTSLFSASARTSPFPLFVSHVVLVSAEEEMRRIDAARIVAAGTVMQDVDADWNRSDVDHPGDPGRFQCGVFDDDVTMSVLVGGTSPDPAGVCFPDVAPEPLLDGLNLGLPVTCVRAKFLRLAGIESDRLATDFARTALLDRLTTHLEPPIRGAGGPGVTSAAVPLF